MALTAIFNRFMSKSPRGRKSEYDPKYCDAIIEFMSSGRTIVDFAASIKVSRDRIYEWAKEFPEFRDALNIGRTASQAWMNEEALKGLWVTKEGPNLNTNLWQYMYGRRFKSDEPDEAKSEATLSSEQVAILSDALSKVAKLVGND